MPSQIQVDKIIDSSASTNKELAEYSSSAWSWGSGVPAGSVLQVKTFSDNSATNSLGVSYVNYFEKSITLKSSSSDVIVNFGFNYVITATTGAGAVVYRDTSATVSTSDTLVFDQNIVDSSGGPYTIYNNTGSIFATYSALFQDTLSSFSAGDTLYYAIFLRKYDTNGNVTAPGGSTANKAFIRIQLTEVQK